MRLYLQLASWNSNPVIQGLTVYKALKQTNLTVGQWVSISGAGGGLGHLDTGEKKKELVMKLGAEKWVDFRESGDNLIKDVTAAADGQGPEAAVIAAGDARPFNQAIMYLRAKGTLVCVGMPPGDALLNVPLALLIAKSLTIVGTAIGNQQDVTETIRMSQLGKVSCLHEVKTLDNLNEILDDLDKGKVAGRVVIKY
ncbi:hypothetical protein D9619_012098 [Psilocybe cf. subviscida]|uniref:Alcohol dehydrogenase-like C-terminal domain-containing protein n=1 Tax=Psilocybe cf. subviscida TaxID=2480587 RepID=A0A8H5EZY4_9AGAR|nr:hypothetical protein D9619_012098 [Psilocybe cf. subviscida]